MPSGFHCRFKDLQCATQISASACVAEELQHVQCVRSLHDAISLQLLKRLTVQADMSSAIFCCALALQLRLPLKASAFSLLAQSRQALKLLTSEKGCSGYLDAFSPDQRAEILFWHIVIPLFAILARLICTWGSPCCGCTQVVDVVLAAKPILV